MSAKSPVMKKWTCCLFAVFFITTISYAQIDSLLQQLKRFENGIFFRSISLVPVTSGGLIYFPHLQELIKTAQLGNPKFYNFIFNNPFEIGIRSNDWFYSLNASLPAFSGGKHFNQRLGSAMFGIEKTMFQNDNYRANFYLGAGYYAYAFSFSKNEPNRQVAFQNLFKTSFLVTPDLKNRGAMLNIGVVLAHREKSKTAIGSYLRLGYWWGLQKSPWKAGTITIVEAPRDRMGLLYLQLLVTISRNK
jgi:hypothetical protein